MTPPNAFNPLHHAQELGLAAARRALDDDEFAVGNLGCNTVNDLELVVVGLAYAPQGHPGHGYFSVSTSPLTNWRCINTTTSTGGNIASIAMAMIQFQLGAASPALTWRESVITTV